MQSDDESGAERAPDNAEGREPEAEEPMPPLSEAWRIEIRRRLAAIRSGEMEMVSSEQVHRELEEIIARARAREADASRRTSD